MPSITPRILIIDDDHQSVMVLSHILKKRGFKIESTISAQNSINMIGSFRPDLILLDIIMPGMNGFEVMEKIKSKGWEIPVIFITAVGKTEEMVKGLESGAVDFISKPVNKAELLARVNTHIALKQSKDQISKANAELKKEIENRKQAEEKFKALSETSFEAVVFVDQNMIIEKNKAAVKLLGLYEQEPELHYNIQEFFEEHDRKRLDLIMDSGNDGPWEFLIESLAGKKTWTQLQGQKVQYKGKTINMLAFRDITRQKEIDKEIYNAVLETQENERKRFSRDIHDGLGAVLSTLKIYTGLIQKEKPEHERKEILNEMKNIIQQAVESARTIANDIMPGVLMDHGLVKAMISFVQAINKTGTMELNFHYPDNLPQLDQSMETHLYRISLELINNTIKYGKASYAALAYDYKNSNLIIDYHDNGVSFDFEEVYNKKKNSQGLINIFSRINLMNAKAYYDNIPGKKMSFHAEIPL